MCSHESRRHRWKVFRWPFVSRHRPRCRWPFLSQQGLRVLPNPRVTFERCFSDYFWVGSDSIFVEYFSVNGGCGRWRIQASPLESVSLTISKTTGSQFSLTVSKSSPAGSADESMRHLWKVFRWWFLSRQRLSFCWLFLSQEGLWALTNPSVTFGIGFVDDFEDDSDSVFINSF